MVSDTIFSADELLSRAAKALATRSTSGPQSAVQKLLAQRGEPESDTVNLSPVARILKQQEAAKAKQPSEPYTEQEWYLRAKLVQLRGQIDFYSRIGGDVGNSALNSIEAEIKGIFKKLNEKSLAKQKEADALKAKLDEQARLKALELPSPNELIKRAAARARGEPIPEPLDPAVEALLKKVRGATVNTSA